MQIRFLHQLMKREIPKGGFLVNGAAIKLMGVNRHDFHPDLGRAVVIAIQAWKLKG
ncbi:glycoside hydrolase family 2 TIM barrel-domain containing protein [Neobacillus drentensis]|uniref:glycoside hydrolase family 2 TIM barrel-domain containing protein n=1 Tax=Neobacillus drentensis TaxID=220684 RepID=UPI002FFDA547